MNFLGFGQSAEIDIVFDDAENRKTAEVKTEDGRVENMLLYYDGETVSGKVNVTLKKPGSKLEHQGIKIEFIGQIELYYDRGNHHEFKCLTKALARHGDLIQNTSYPFEFPNVEKQFEVYAGSNVRLRYFLRATIVRRLSDITKEVDIAVHTLCSYPEMNSPIKMEVGIEDCLHIEFEYNKSKYHLKDIIIGKIYFLLVRIKIKHMEIAIIKRECTGTGPNMFSENETIGKFEIMDGAPVKGESIPIRVFLASYYLTPTMRDINKKFSVKYFLNLVLMDTEDRRYFKQQEITLWRKAELQRYQMQSQQHTIAGQHVHAMVAPAHLVGGPTGPAAANTNITHAIDSDSSVGASVATTSEGRMGLFTRESPNQEFSQQQDSMPTSPTTPTPPPMSAALSSATATGERGMADGAAATNTSMLSSTPPPLPAASGISGSDAGSLAQREPIEFLADEDDEPLLVANTNVSAAAAAAVGVADLLPPPDHVDDGLTDVLLTSDAPETKASASATVPQAETKKAVETVAPLSAD